jgi:hypothetical protein
MTLWLDFQPVRLYAQIRVEAQKPNEGTGKRWAQDQMSLEVDKHVVLRRYLCKRDKICIEYAMFYFSGTVTRFACLWTCLAAGIGGYSATHEVSPRQFNLFFLLVLLLLASA